MFGFKYLRDRLRFERQKREINRERLAGILGALETDRSAYDSTETRQHRYQLSTFKRARNDSPLMVRARLGAHLHTCRALERAGFTVTNFGAPTDEYFHAWATIKAPGLRDIIAKRFPV